MKLIDQLVSCFTHEDDVLTIVHPEKLREGGTLALRINIPWQFGCGFTAALDRSEVASLRDTLRALEVRGGRSIVRLHADDGMELSLCYDNMGEPFREGAVLAFADGGMRGASIFLEARQRTELRELFDRMLA